MFRTFICALLLCTSSAHGITPEVAKEAQNLLKSDAEQAGFEHTERVQTFIRKGKKITRTFRELTFRIRLALHREGEPLRTILVGKNCEQLDSAFLVRCGTRNGVNTPYTIAEPAGYSVVGLRRLVQADGGPSERVYTAYTSSLDTEENVFTGKEFLVSKIAEGLNQLREKGVMSRSYPDKLVADVIPPDYLYRLAIIEHIDHDRFRSEPLAQLIREVLVILALNQNDAYRYAVSSAGALGLYQFIPSTYKLMVVSYPDAMLVPSHRDGMLNIENAVAAAALLLDFELAKMPTSERLLRTDRLEEYLAASYNGGATRALRTYSQGKDFSQIPNKETSIYIQKLRAVRDLARNPSNTTGS